MIQQHNCATSLSLIPSYCDIKMGVDWSSLETQGKGSQNMLLWINSYVNKTKKENPAYVRKWKPHLLTRWPFREQA